MAQTNKQKNPYTPGTADYQAYELELQRQAKADYENSAEGQKAKEDARKQMEIKKQQEEIKRRTGGTGGITGGATGDNWRLTTPDQKAKFIKEEAQKNGVTLSDKDVKQVKDEYLKEVTPEGVDPYSGRGAGKEARDSVEKLDTFSMPKTNKLGDGTPIDTSTPLWGDKKPETDKTAFPRSIWQAWKNDEFGPHEGKDAQQIRNNLILNSALTAIGNAARGFQGGLNQTAAEHKDSMWKKRQEENMQKQTERENVQRDVVMDTQTKEMLANRWSSYTPEQKQGMLDAYNAYTSGSLSKAEDLMRNSMGDKEYSEWLQYFENLKAQLSVNADARAQEQLRYMETMGPLGMIMGLAGKLIPGL